MVANSLENGTYLHYKSYNFDCLQCPLLWEMSVERISTMNENTNIKNNYVSVCFNKKSSKYIKCYTSENIC